MIRQVGPRKGKLSLIIENLFKKVVIIHRFVKIMIVINDDEDRLQEILFVQRPRVAENLAYSLL